MSDPTSLKVLSDPKIGAVQHENLIDRYVGCDIHHEQSRATGKNIFSFSDEVVEVPVSGYYKRMVADRDLLPADEATAKFCGVAFDASVVAARKAAFEKAAADAKKAADDAAKKAADEAKAAAKAATAA